jgi:hypothetical protein
VSNAKLSRLELMVEVLERRLDVTPNIATLHENDDGTPDVEAFQRSHGMTPEEVEAKGGVVVVRTNWKNPNVEIAPPPYKTDWQSVSDPYGIKGNRS